MQEFQILLIGSRVIRRHLAIGSKAWTGENPR